MKHATTMKSLLLTTFALFLLACATWAQPVKQSEETIVPDEQASLAAQPEAASSQLAARRFGAVGAVYTMTNETGGNAIVVYDRYHDGSLSYAGSFPTGGAGSGGGLGNQGGSAIVTVNLSGGTAPYTVTLTNGGGTKTSSTLPITFTVSPTVTTTYAVASATDVYGCPVNASGNATITVGAGALPDTNITGIPPSVSDANVSFSFTGLGGCSAVTFECKLDSGGWTACTSPQSRT